MTNNILPSETKLQTAKGLEAPALSMEHAPAREAGQRLINGPPGAQISKINGRYRNNATQASCLGNHLVGRIVCCIHLGNLSEI